MSELASVVVSPRGAHQATVIWLHGLGADGHDFEPIVPDLGLREHGVKFVFPHAPVRPVTINGGMPMRAWYDILGMDLSVRADHAGVMDSVDKVNQLVALEAEAVGFDRIFLAGFSQGGVIAAHTALRLAHPIAGLVMLSTYLPLAEVLGESRQQPETLPIWMAHGRQDPVVPIMLGRMAYQQLLAWKYAPDWHDYPMPHAVCPEEIADLRKWWHQQLEVLTD